MKAMKFVMLFTMSVFLLGNMGCDDLKENVGDRINKEAGINENDTTAEKSKKYVDTAQKAVKLLKAVPAAAPYTEIALGVLGLVSTGLGFWVSREKKKVKVHKATADNYREGINAAISNGTDQTVAEVGVLKDVLDKSTKEHFNAEGVEKL